MSNSVTKDQFSSRWGFILAAVGAAIGMGNIWLFPYRVGELGGATFIIHYIICVAVLGFIGVLGEITIGRLTGAGPVNAFKKALEMRGGSGRIGEVFGWIPIFVIFVISLGYSVVVSWILRFFVGSITGSAFIACNTAQHFTAITGSCAWQWIIITLFVIGISMIRGVEKGIEKANKFMIPIFFVLFLILVMRVAFLPKAIDGYKFLFMPKWDFFFNARTWILALGQSFYSLSIFGSISVVYGSYTKKSEDLIFSVKNIVIFDTVASIMASLVIIPAVFSFGKDLNSESALMFITIPDIFKAMPLGQICMVIFFLAVFFAAITSLISILEVVVEVLQNKFKIHRSLSVAITVSTVAICSILSNGYIDKLTDILQIHFVPFCALISGIFIFWILPSKLFTKEIQSGHTKTVSKWIIPMGRYVFCGLVIVIYISNILCVV
ncbi:MAG: sodium-dependent transporter [Endomicrobium sp.]|nr:sodium-dependent transporter [Endomicrobium sp.]